MKTELTTESKVKFLEQNLHSEVIVDVTRYLGSSTPVRYKDFKEIPGLLKGINPSTSQQFEILFNVPDVKHLAYYSCFNELRYSWGHTAHSECITVVKRPLSAITDEDFLEVMFKQFPFQPTFKKGKIYQEHLNINQADYLRSKGYALTWMGLSVDEMCAAGWIKLSEKGEGNG